jgi:hypothetical protein
MVGYKFALGKYNIYNPRFFGLQVKWNGKVNVLTTLPPSAWQAMRLFLEYFIYLLVEL